MESNHTPQHYQLLVPSAVTVPLTRGFVVDAGIIRRGFWARACDKRSSPWRIPILPSDARSVTVRIYLRNPSATRVRTLRFVKAVSGTKSSGLHPMCGATNGETHDG